MKITILEEKEAAESTSKRYEARGVSSSKAGLHKIVEGLDKGLSPGAFCKIQQDILTGDKDKCNIIHSDGSGSKSIIGYLHYKETGDTSIFEGIAQDSIVMNIDDLLCVGATDGILISSTINRNKKNFPDEALSGLIEGTEHFLAKMRKWGIGIYSGGGETADVGDLTGSVLVDSCATVVMKRGDVIDLNNLRPGLAIVGLGSSGRSLYEEYENSGIGSNGLTSARHELLSSYYKERYPETVDPNMNPELAYRGRFRLEDRLPGSDMTVGQALLSPTRTYAPVIKKLLESHRDKVKGIVHCSGGGQSKCLKFGRGLLYSKTNLMEVPTIFRVIQEESGTSWEEMYQVFNMGHRMEIYCEHEYAGLLVKLIKEFGIDACVVGQIEKSEYRKNMVNILHHENLRAKECVVG